ncbi:MAG: methyltransferase domain-containing protein [Anaerolineaceae bacterium]|nr:methyltransferase domain-containing protein [Anaerolineaceae bacterium]
MNRMSDQSFLRKSQYANPKNLNARIKIHQLFSTPGENWNDFVYNHLSIQGNNKVLALGCGNATQWTTNLSRFPEKCLITLSDLSLGMLSGTRLGLAADERVNLSVLDAQALPYTEALFDRVTANHMLYHVPDIEKALKEVGRVIKPDGLFIAATNGEDHMRELYELVTDFNSAYVAEDNKHTRFSLENGIEKLGKVFPYVKKVLHLSNLWVTDAVMLTDYVFSMWDAQGVIPPDSYKDMQAYFVGQIDRSGGIKIRKSTGLFLASQEKETLRSVPAL